MKYIRFILTISVVLIFMFCCMKYMRWEFGVGNSLVYRLPENYEGFFYIKKSNDGVAVRKNGSDVYEYVVPANGVLKVKSIGPFRRMHKQIVVYPSGKIIPEDLPVKMDEKIRLFNGSISSDEVLTFIIGSTNDYQNYLKIR